MSALILIQARMGSERLPGKVLEPIGPLTALEHVYRRAEMTGARVLVAMPQSNGDMRLMRHCLAKGLACVEGEGEESDVVTRLWSIVRSNRAQIIVRLTGDCPFVRTTDITHVVGRLLLGGLDVANNTGFPGPRTIADGLDVEAFTSGALYEAYSHAEGSEREHVTPWMYRNLRSGTVPVVDPPRPLHRWTLDTPEDLAWFRRIAERIDVRPPGPDLAELHLMVENDPTLRNYVT